MQTKDTIHKQSLLKKTIRYTYTAHMMPNIYLRVCVCGPMPPSRAIARARRAVARSSRTVGRANRHVLLLHARLSLIKFLKLLCRCLDNGILLCCFEHHILFCLFKKSIDSCHIDFICGLTLRSGRCAKPSGVVFLLFCGNNGPGHLLLCSDCCFAIKCLGYIAKVKDSFPFFCFAFFWLSEGPAAARHAEGPLNGAGYFWWPRLQRPQ